MPKIGTLLTAIAKKIGIPTDTPEFIDLLGANLDVPQTLADAFNVDILTFDAAMNNPRLKSHFYATSLNEVDRRLLDSMNDLQFSDAAKTEITALKSTFERIDLFNKKIKELTTAKSEATGQEKNTLTAQINALQAQIAQMKSEAAQQVQAIQETHSQEMYDLYLNGKIAARKLDTSVYPEQVMQDIARTYINSALQEKKIKPVYANKAVSLRQAQTPDLEVYVDNKIYTLDSLIDEVLAANKLISVNGSQQQENGQQRQQGQHQQTTQQSQQQQNGQNITPLNGMLAKLDQFEADYKRVNGAN